MFKQHSRIFHFTLVIGDIVLTFTAFVVAFYLRFYSGFFAQVEIPDYNSYVIMCIAAPILTVISFYMLNIYQTRRIESVFIDLMPILSSSVILVLSLSAITFYYRETSFSRLTFILFGITFFILVGFERILIRSVLKYLRRKGLNVKRLLLVGAGDIADRLINTLTRNKSFGYQIVGIIDDHNTNSYYPKQHGVKIIGRTKELARTVHENHIDKVIITLPIRAYDKICRIVEKCEYEGIESEIVPDYFKIIQPKTNIKNLEGLPIVSVRSLPTDNAGYTIAKRAFDFVFSSSVIVLGMPVFLLIALIVKLTSPGPVFFSQERIGINRKRFKMYKFRTMRVAPPSESDVTWTTNNDNRRTWIGTILRKTSLDELPQFWNVLRGDMSIVGPRPERPYFAQQFKDRFPKYMVRHQIKTGITGWAQVNGWRGDTSIQKRLEYDLYYLENWSFLFDLKIIGLTLFKSLNDNNAY
ncbi:MAG: undecaprenyl-phosphate glucose phosphotransferase [Deferribacteres bacterium]|nr:undecaprenyl-phosphate glucose phosphotransferase [candidate division KSB1 bacterium]MCB9504094.1 undecaprenyl-phosphate glucose phosphotransferase [Deferribacteres bacterium]